MQNYKLLTLDIWDTVLRRDCHPDMIKDLTSRYLYLYYVDGLKSEYQDINCLTRLRYEIESNLGKMAIMEGYDDEYSILDVFSIWVETVFLEKIPDNIVQNLYDYELDMEKKHVYFDPTIVSEISKYSYEKIAYLSDFYTDHVFIDEVLKAARCTIQFDYKYVSCEYKINKRSGNLYKKIEDDLKVLPSEHLHVGDNVYSDIKVAERLGINTVLYQPQEEHRIRQKKENNYRKLEKNTIDFMNKKIDDYSNKNSYSKQRGYITGCKSAVFFINYVMWVIEQCTKAKIDTIYYFTREGEFFKQIHDVIYEKNPYNIILPKAELLEVSRVGTFCASLREVTLHEMFRIWNQYSIQSLGAFFKSNNIKREVVTGFLEKYNLDFDEILIYPWQDERVQKLFIDQEFIRTFQNEIDDKKRKLLAYTATKGLFQNDKRTFAIVDIGWRGTIQDNICYIFNDSFIVGYYLGLIPFLNEQPANSVKAGYLNLSGNAEHLLRNVTPIEMLCNSPNGSVTDYYAGQAVRKNEKEEDEIYYSYTKYVQQGVLDMIAVYCESLSLSALTSRNFIDLSFDIFNNIIKYPPKDLAETYFTLCHNEEFGLGEYVDKHTKLDLRPFIKAVFSKKSRRELIDFLNSTSWPQGYLVKYNMLLLNKMYNRILEKREQCENEIC